MEFTRRRFLKTSAIAAGFAGLQRLLHDAGAAEKSAIGYGPLQTDPAGVIDLPAGFSYSIIGRQNETMDDGLLLPGAPDGMAAFPGPNGLTILIRNHELTPDQGGAFGQGNELLHRVPREKMYDLGDGKTPGCGGTTTVVFDTASQQVVRQFLSLAGTYRNCAGGPTPWNSWITCEETVDRVGPDEKNLYIADKDHGYNFEVPARADVSLAEPVPLKDMGRFRHEAIAIDPASGAVYETEDRDDGLIYRFLPHHPKHLVKGGRLQALKIAARPSLDTRNWTSQEINVGDSLDVEWIDVFGVDNPQDDLRQRGFHAGAAQFARGEGMWHSSDGIYFACTNGGKAKLGQIWRYIPSPDEGNSKEKNSRGKLELFIEPNDSKLVEAADNLTVSPWGDLILCEDRTSDQVRLVGVTPTGHIYTFADNHQHTEFAGSTFSPDGSTLFVNLQGKGLTLAITGPWQKPLAG